MILWNCEAGRYLVARDNVALELGVFAAGLGRERTFIILQHTQQPVHLPSDLQGITPAMFNWPEGVEFNSDFKRLHAELGPAAQQIRQAMMARGIEDGTLKPLSAGMIFLALWLRSRGHSLNELDRPFQLFQEKTARLGSGDAAYASKATKYACQCLEALGMVKSGGGNEYFLTPLGENLLDSDKMHKRFPNAYDTFEEVHGTSQS